MSRAADLARKCFAVARSTSHAGERAAAINRGMALLERAGLDPDDFDIPGRARKRPHDLGTNARPGRPFMRVSPDDLDEIARAFSDQLQATTAFRDAMRGQAEALRNVQFSMDDLVREAVAETLKRRRERAFREAMRKDSARK